MREGFTSRTAALGSNPVSGTAFQYSRANPPPYASPPDTPRQQVKCATGSGSGLQTNELQGSILFTLFQPSLLC